MTIGIAISFLLSALLFYGAILEFQDSRTAYYPSEREWAAFGLWVYGVSALLTASVGVLHLFGVAWVWATAPIWMTSIALTIFFLAAYGLSKLKKKTKQGKREGQLMGVLALIKRYPLSTSLELSRHGFDRYVIARRLPELAKAGLVMRRKSRECTVGKRPATTWEAVI